MCNRVYNCKYLLDFCFICQYFVQQKVLEYLNILSHYVILLVNFLVSEFWWLLLPSCIEI